MFLLLFFFSQLSQYWLRPVWYPLLPLISMILWVLYDYSHLNYKAAQGLPYSPEWVKELSLRYSEAKIKRQMSSCAAEWEWPVQIDTYVNRRSFSVQGSQICLPWAAHMKSFISSEQVKGQFFESSMRIQQVLLIHESTGMPSWCWS